MKLALLFSFLCSSFILSASSFDLYKACMKKNIIEVERLLNLPGVDINARHSKLLFSPLHIAAMRRDSVMLYLLLEKGATVDIKDDEEKTPLHLAVIYESYPCAHMLLCYGANINEKNKEGDTPLHLAVKSLNKDMVIFLLENHASKYLQNKKKDSPYDVAFHASKAAIDPTKYKEIIEIFKFYSQ